MLRRLFRALCCGIAGLMLLLALGLGVLWLIGSCWRPQAIQVVLYRDLGKEGWYLRTEATFGRRITVRLSGRRPLFSSPTSRADWQRMASSGPPVRWRSRAEDSAPSGSFWARQGFSDSRAGGTRCWIRRTTVPYWGPVGVLVLPSVAWCWWRRRVAHGMTDGLCRRCRYDLRGSPGPTCPECGAVIDRAAVAGTAS